MKKYSAIIFLLCIFILVFYACSFSREDRDKIRDLRFTVVDDREIPQELMSLIEEKKQGVFKLTFHTDRSSYLVVGYGEQPTGGYSISVNEFYLTSNAAILQTTLIGPSQTEAPSNEPSFPYIVIMTDYLRETPVIFQ